MRLTLIVLHLAHVMQDWRQAAKAASQLVWPCQGKFPLSSTVCFIQVTRIDFSPDVIHCQVFSESRPRTSDASHFSSLIGRRVAKSFGSHGLHCGTVQSINAQGTWFYVTYDDGDGEDLNFKEVSRLLLPEPRLSPEISNIHLPLQHSTNHGGESCIEICPQLTSYSM